MNDKPFIYLAFGAGVQSTALLVAGCLGLHGVQRPDVALFADTHWEPRYVYEQVERMTAWAAQHGVPVETCSRGDLGALWLEHKQNRGTSMPIYVHFAAKVVCACQTVVVPGVCPLCNGEGFTRDPERTETGILKRNCTRDFKIRAMRGALRAKGVKVARAQLGISYDEVERMRDSDVRWVQNTYPLIDARLRRHDCEELVVRAGLPRPLKSSCVQCPYHGDDYWRFLHAEHPADFERACALDDAQRAPGFSAAKGLHGTPFLHRSGKPLRSLPFADRSGQGDMPWGGSGCDSGYCHS